MIDQGTCGSCYTFSTVEALESLVAIQAKSKLRLRALSKQQILDCANDGNYNAGCAGGNIHATYDYIKANGLMLESLYPYKSKVDEILFFFLNFNNFLFILNYY